MSRSNLSPPEILLEEIERYSQRGYRVASQTSHTAQLIQPKQFNILLAIFGLLFWGVGLLIYIVFFLAQKEKTVFLKVDDAGNINNPLPKSNSRANAEADNRKFFLVAGIFIALLFNIWIVLNIVSYLLG